MKTGGVLSTTLFLLGSMFCVRAFAIRPFSRRLFLAAASASGGSSFGNRFSSSSSTCSSSASTATCTDRTPTTIASTFSSDNPLLASWKSQPFHLPPFSLIQPRHFEAALQQAMKQELNDLQAIVEHPETPNFENTISAYDRCGVLLDRVGSVYGNYCSSLNTDEMQQVQTAMTPILSRHSSATYTLPGLFEKIHAVYQSRHDSNLTPEQVRLVERIHLDFVRAGAQFSPQQQEEYAELKAQLASLATQFQQNVMKDEETYELVLHRDDLSGCPESLVEAAHQAANERGKNNDEYVITLSRSLVEPFLTFSDRSDLRQTAWQAWTRRGEMSPNRDNLAIATKMLKLRQQIANMHGYKTFAEYQCVDRMAKTPENVMELLENVWQRAKVSANNERLALEEYVKETGDSLPGGIQPWDWRYYAEKVRIAKYDFDESLLKPYLSLDRVVDAVFAVSNKLFGLKYVKRDDIESYHPDVVTYEVRDEDTDELVSIFVHDNFARPFKSSGAWMSEYRSQTRNQGVDEDDMDGVPIVSNNNNFAKGKNTLLSFDDASTLFHEMGHGHHGMLSNATYSRLASTNVMTDWVELPSQLMEHWFEQPQVLKEYARHYETNEPVPDELLQKLKNAKEFNQGFATIEYTACALMDMALHQIDDYGDDFDLAEFEQKELERLGMPQGIVMRHRPAHFQHLFSSNHYAAGYYVYLWAEVLDADVFAAFKETGDVFDKETADMARKYIYSSGNTVAPDELFRLFRGRDPDIQYMLKKKGLLQS